MNRIMIAAIVVIVIAIVGIGAYGYNYYASYPQNGTISIYAADSLGKSINQTTVQFNSQHPNVKVQATFAGSSSLISQITQLNKTPDIMVSADYTLINSKLIPNYASYNIMYARNEMVIAYTNKSKNSSQINSNNWYQILSQNGVKYAFSDPNSDPAGYRAVMMIQLANTYYNNSSIFSNLVSSNSAITSQANGTGYVISVPTNENPTGNLTIRSDAAALMPLLQSDSIDYVITYKSLAEQANASYVTLPNELQLSNTSYLSNYSAIKLKQKSDTTNGSTVTLTPIIYSITILNNAPNKLLAEEYVELMLSSTGVQITKNNFLDPITPAILTNTSSNLPSALQQYVTSG